MIRQRSFSLASIAFLFSFQSRALVVDKIQQVCGLSDTVYSYILEAAGEKSAAKHSLSASVGSARKLIIYGDQSWILTLEFLSNGEVEEDRTCIIAKGDLSNQELATDILKRSEWIGPVVPQSGETVPTQPPPAKPKNIKKSLNEV